MIHGFHIHKLDLSEHAISTFGTWRPSVSEKGNDREIRH